MCFSFSLSNESSLEKEKDERKKGMRSYAFWVLSFRTQFWKTKKIKKDKKGQREQRDKFRVSNLKKKKREVFPSSKGLFFVLFFVLTSKGIIYIIPKRDRTTLSLS